MGANAERPVIRRDDGPRRVVHLFGGGERPSITTNPTGTLGFQNRACLERAAYGNARIGIERDSLRMIELAGRRATEAMGASR